MESQIASKTTVEQVQSVEATKPPIEAHQKHTLGHVRLRDEHTDEIILIPAPSSDPNDPLRW